MDLVINALSALFGAVVGGLLSYWGAVQVFGRQQKAESKQKFLEEDYTMNKLLYRMLELYKRIVNKCFWEIQKPEEFTVDYYFSETRKMRRILDKLKYLTIFSSVPIQTYEKYQMDIFSFWRLLTKFIGQEKDERLQGLNMEKVTKEELANAWTLENSIVEEMQNEIGSKMKLYLAALKH